MAANHRTALLSACSHSVFLSSFSSHPPNSISTLFSCCIVFFPFNFFSITFSPTLILSFFFFFSYWRLHLLSIPFWYQTHSFDIFFIFIFFSSGLHRPSSFLFSHSLTTVLLLSYLFPFPGSFFFIHIYRLDSSSDVPSIPSYHSFSFCVLDLLYTIPISIPISCDASHRPTNLTVSLISRFLFPIVQCNFLFFNRNNELHSPSLSLYHSPNGPAHGFRPDDNGSPVNGSPHGWLPLSSPAAI